MKRVIGNPTDYSNNRQNNGFDKRFDLKIPIAETDQKKVHKLEGAEPTDEYEPIPNSLGDNFNRMNIRSPINTNNKTREEEKRIMPPSIN